MTRLPRLAAPRLVASRLAIPGLELPRRGLVGIAVLVVAVSDVLALTTLDELSAPVVGMLGAALFTVVGLLAALAGGRKLPLDRTIVAAGTPAALSGLISWSTREDGFELWFLGSGAFLLTLLSLRGRAGWAWAGMVAVSATTIGIALGTGADLAAAALNMVRQVAILLIGTVLAVAIGRTERRLQELAEAAAAREAERSAHAAAGAERRERLLWALELARPLLTSMSAGTPLDDAQRRDAALVEAELRDGLRARALARSPVTEAARNARRRGVEVLLLDDRGAELSPDEHERALALVARELDAAEDGRVVARLLPPGRETVLTLLVTPADPASAARRVEFP